MSNASSHRELALCEKKSQNGLGVVCGGYPPLSQIQPNLPELPSAKPPEKMIPFKVSYMKKWVGAPGPPHPQKLFKCLPPETALNNTLGIPNACDIRYAPLVLYLVYTYNCICSICTYVLNLLHKYCTCCRSTVRAIMHRRYCIDVREPVSQVAKVTTKTAHKLTVRQHFAVLHSALHLPPNSGLANIDSESTWRPLSPISFSQHSALG